MSDRPLLGLVVEPGAGAELRPLVRALARLVEVRALHRCPRRPDAGLVAPLLGGRGLDAADVGHGWGGLPVAVAVPGTVIVGDVRIELPGVAIDVDGVDPRGVLVRQRWRERLGRPRDWVVVADDLPPEARADALATAAAVIVRSAELPLAIALGAPTVTDASAAAAFGLTHGREVLVGGDPADARRQAEQLAADPAQAAALGAAARRFAEGHLDRRAAAQRVVAALGLDPPSAGLDRLARQLLDLHTPASAPIRRRVARATLALGDPQ